MAVTLEGRRLTEAHRLAQARLGARTVSLLRDLWPLLDMTALDATTPRFLRVAVPMVQSQAVASARLSSSYVQSFRRLEVPNAAPLRPFVAPPPPAQQVATSLTVTGPVSVKQQVARGVPLERAARSSLTRCAGSAMRLGLQGGRDTVNETIRRDPVALGYARVTSGDPCAFCAMLASRGPVYSKDTVEFEAHDSCSCQHEIVYSRDAEWPAGSRELRERWDEATRGYSGDDALNAFRRSLAAG